MINRLACMHSAARLNVVMRLVGRRKLVTGKPSAFDRLMTEAGVTDEGIEAYGMQRFDGDWKIQEKNDSAAKVDAKLPGLRLVEMLEKVDEKQCRGCGAKFQFEDQRKEGYIDLKRLKSAENGVDANEVLEKLAGLGGTMDQDKASELYEEPREPQVSSDGKMYSVEDYENDPVFLDSIKEVEEIFEDKVIPKDICDRCVLINNSKYKELREIEINIERIPVSHFVTNIFKRIKEGSVVLMVLDATDLEGSVPKEYIPKLATGDYELFIAINKIDCLPNTISKERMKGWFSGRIRELMPELSVDNKHLALVSSKETIGLKKLVSALKDLKVAEKRKYIHTLGVTNAGKSSLLNSLRIASKKFNPKYYKDPFDIKAAQLVDKEFGITDFGYGENSGELTVSFFPGTTLRSKEVEDIKVGTRVFDTPGLPTKHRVSDSVANYSMLKNLLMTKEPKLSRVVLDQGGAIWLGALARIDLKSGPTVGVITFISNEVTIVRNTSQKANVNYIKGFGTELYPTYSASPNDTAFTKHEIKIKLQMKHKVCEQELAIHGLGSLTFRQLENTNIEGKTLELDLYLPADIGFTIRPALLGPKEAASAIPVVRQPRRGNQSGIN